MTRAERKRLKDKALEAKPSDHETSARWLNEACGWNKYCGPHARSNYAMARQAVELARTYRLRAKDVYPWI